MIFLERNLNPKRTRVIKDGETVTRDQLHSEGWELLPVGFLRVTSIGGIPDMEDEQASMGVVSLSRSAKFQVSAEEPDEPIEIFGEVSSGVIKVRLYPGQRLGIVNERLSRRDIEIRNT